MEKRRFQRFLLDTAIELQTKNKKAKNQSKTKDLSKSGICITTSDKPLEKGQIYLLSFKLPNFSLQITVEAKVVWTNLYENHEAPLFDNGLEFTAIKQKYLDMIEEYSMGSVIEK